MAAITRKKLQSHSCQMQQRHWIKNVDIAFCVSYLKDNELIVLLEQETFLFLKNCERNDFAQLQVHCKCFKHLQ